MEQSYKEKYEQAIERLKQWDREHPCAGYVLSDRDKFIFPELAESEDEKVRKELIKHLKELSDWKEDEVIPVKNPSYYRQWASWLENVPVTIDHEKREGFHLGYKACLEKQGEQKPEENKGNIGGNSPNWSEEDEDYLFLLNSICKDAEEKYRNSPNVLVKKEIANARNWLQSLKGRVQPQPKQEWSEEDKKIINGLIDSLTRISLNTRTDSTSPNYTFYKEIDWLKSLRPQNKWKPSETDIMILEKVFNGKIDPKDFQATLFSVLEQLKKLKEGKV